MGIVSRYLNWNLGGFGSILDYSYLSKDNSRIVVCNKQQECVFQFNGTDWTVLELQVENENLGSHFFEVLGNLYKICRGCVFRLNVSAASNKSFQFFPGSSSSDQGSNTWENVSQNVGDVVQVAGTSVGFAVIVCVENSFYLNHFEMGELVTLKSTAKLPVCSKKEENWKMVEIDLKKLSPDLVKNLFGKLCLVLTDVLLVSRPDGYVMLYPIVDALIMEPVPINYDNEILSYASNCENGLFLIYESGKIAQINYCDQQISYKVHYLSTKVVTAAVASFDNGYFCFWSDGVKLLYFGPTDFKILEIMEHVTNLRGIVSLQVIDDCILAGNVNSNFYKIQLNDLANGENLVKHDLNEIKGIGADIDKLKDKLESVNIVYEALLTESSDVSQIMPKVVGNELHLQNMSNKTLDKSIWCLEIECSHNGIQYVKKYPFKENFMPNSIQNFPLIHFSSLDSETLSIRLIADFKQNNKLLILNICEISNLKTTQKSLCDEINSILNYSINRLFCRQHVNN